MHLDAGDGWGSYPTTAGHPGVLCTSAQLPLNICALPTHPAAPYTNATGAAGNATLADVCFKPFGGKCATQSVLQYWHMDKGYYLSEQVGSWG